MSSTIIKIAVNESSPFSSTNNNVSFDIPPGLNIDFGKSYLEIDLRANPSTEAAADATALNGFNPVYKPTLSYTNATDFFPHFMFLFVHFWQL